MYSKANKIITIYQLRKKGQQFTHYIWTFNDSKTLYTLYLCKLAHSDKKFTNYGNIPTDRVRSYR